MHSSKVCFGFKLIAVLLALVTVVTLIPKNLTAHAFDSASQPDLAGTITDGDAEQYSIVSRDQASEIDLNSFIFNTKNGEKAEFFYPYDVKYIDDEGLVHDKDTTISKAESGFVSAGTGVNISFPDKISDGVSVANSDGRYSVIFAPLDSADSYSNGFLADDNSTVRYTGSKASFEYGSTFAGLKENIVLNEYSGINSWSFRLLTNGLTLHKLDGQYILVDDESSVMFFGSILAFTADDRNNTFGELTVETVTESVEYILTVSVSDEWLKSDDTSYPVTIDPSITVNYATGSSAIQDEILSSTSTYSVTYDVLNIGKGNNNEKLRGAICFPGLDLSGKCITSANLEIRDVMCERTPTLVEMYEYTGSAWTENTTLTWSNASNYGDLLDSHYIKYGGGNTSSDIQRYSFDITPLAMKWAAGTASPSQGVLIKTTDAFENASGSSHRCFASKDYGSNTYKPSLVITYVEPKGYNSSFTFDTRGLDSNISVYNYHNQGNVLVTYSFDVKTKGFPLPLFYAYNSSDDSWRLSLEETITQDAGRYLYTDGYGTEYYFTFKETGVYENEALGTEISVNSTEITYETEDEIKKTFDPATGRISKLEYDKDTYTYVYGAYGLTDINKNGANLFTLAYSGSELTSAFGYSFSYTGGRLTAITDKYGNATNIVRTYTDLNLLSSFDIRSALTTDGINITFNSALKATRIKTYRGSTSYSISDDSYYYGTGDTGTYSNLSGTDPDDPQNVHTSYVFDVKGQTVSDHSYVFHDDLTLTHIATNDYRSDDIVPGSLAGGGSTNLLYTSSFENGTWDGGTVTDSDEAVFGSKVLSVNASSSAYSYINSVPGTYCFSVYLKGEGTSARISVNGYGTSKTIPLNTSWQRIFFTFTVETQNIITINLINAGDTTLFADCAQIEKGETPTTYNALKNTDFNTDVTSSWTGGSLSSYLINKYTCCVSADSTLSQTVSLGSVSEDTPFKVSGWLMSFVRPADAEIRLAFHGTQTTYVSVPFEGYASACGMLCCAEVLPPEGTGDITSVTYSIVNNSETAAVYVDDLLLSFGSIARIPDYDGGSQGLVFSSNSDGTCSLTGIGTCSDTDIVIPDRSPAGDIVTAIANNAFKDNGNIVSVTGGSDIEYIGDNAFRNCINLKSVSFGEGLKRIRYNAFQDCVNLETVQLPDSLLRIDNVAFGNCPKLKTFIIPENVDTLGTYIFYNCTGLEKVTVPISVTSIPDYTFANISGNVKIYYAGTSSQWALVIKGTNALPPSYSLMYSSEVKWSNIYTYMFSGGVKSSVSVTSLDDNSPVESYIYDADGNVTEYTDSNGNTTVFEYDSNGNLTAIVAPGGRETEYTYNSNGDVISETDANGNITAYTYHSNGRLNTQSQGGTTVTYTYYHGSASTVTISGSGYSNSYYYSYNNYGNLIHVWMGMTLQSVAAYTYTSGGRGKLASKTESNGYCETYKYDSVGNLIEAAVSGNTVYDYLYDYSGSLLVKNDAYLNISEITLLTPDGGAITYTFDNSGNVIKTVQEDGTIMFPDGSTYTSLPANISSNSAYDNVNRETEFALKLTQNETETDIFTITRTYLDNDNDYAPEEVVEEAFSNAGSFRYVYDSCGNLTEVRDVNTNTILLKYTYDSKDQLIREDNSFATASYTWEYDANGNIKSKTVYPFNTGTLGTATSSKLYSYSGDKLTSYGGTAISYSGLNPTNWRNASSLTWRGRQLISRTNGSSTTTYEYNDEGLRAKKINGGSVTRYVWDGDKLIREETPNYNVTFFYDGDELIGFSVLGNNYYYGKDSFGVIRYIYNQNGSLYCTYAYDAWGNLITRTFTDQTNTIAGYINPILYKSYYYDSESGFYYLQSRYYDPIVGRFLNADDAAYLGVSGTVSTWNLFSYCENNPVMNKDSRGTVVSPAHIIGAIIGGIIGSIGGYFLTRWLADLLKLTGWKRSLFIIGLTAVIGATSAVIGYFIGPYVAKAWNLLSAKLAGLVRGTYRGIANIENFKMVHKINVAKHLWNKLVGPKVTATGILSLIYKALSDGEWKYQLDGVIRIVLKVGKEFVVVTGVILKDGFFHVGDAWVWDGISNIWGQ